MLHYHLFDSTLNSDTNTFVATFLSILTYFLYLIPLLLSFAPTTGAILSGLAICIHGCQTRTWKPFLNGIFLIFIGIIAGYTDYWLVLNAQAGDGEYGDFIWGCFVGGCMSLVLVALPLMFALQEHFEGREEGAWDEGTWYRGSTREWGGDEESVRSGFSGETLVSRREYESDSDREVD